MGNGARVERADIEWPFAMEGSGMGKKISGICSGTGNSYLTGANLLGDFKGHNKPEWFPSHPQPLLAPGADGICAPSAPSPHSSTMAVLTPALGNANRGS